MDILNNRWVNRRIPATNIVEATVDPEVLKTLRKLKNTDLAKSGILIGGLALAFWSKPRQTQDVDILVEQVLTTAPDGFNLHRTHAIEDKQTGVEVELVTPKLIGIPKTVADKVKATAIDRDGFKVASVAGLITLKLFGSDNKRREFQDLADIISLMSENEIPDMSEWKLSKKHQVKFNSCLIRAKSDEQGGVNE